MASSIVNLSGKRVRDDSDDPRLDSVDVKRLREDLLDDSYPDAPTQDLDFVIRTLEEEISLSAVPVVDLTSESGESQPDLGYLLEASDDQLGLPPPEHDLVRVAEYGWFDDEFPSHDSFGYGFGFGDGFSGNDDYVAVDGLFEYADVVFESIDCGWRHETE